MSLLPILAQAAPVVDEAAAAASAAAAILAEERNLWQYLTQDGWRTWIEGGWVMIPLLLAAVFLYSEAVATVLFLGRTGLRKIPAAVWQRWVSAPSEAAEGYVGDTVRYVVAARDREEVMARLEAVRLEVVPKVNLKIVILGVLVAISPLMGLLGTVIGMLTTFSGLAGGSGQTVDLVADGIRVALITTQTGLTIAIPGYLLIYSVVKRRNEFQTFLAQLETLVLQEKARAGLLS